MNQQEAVVSLDKKVDVLLKDIETREKQIDSIYRYYALTFTTIIASFSLIKYFFPTFSAEEFALIIIFVIAIVVSTIPFFCYRVKFIELYLCDKEDELNKLLSSNVISYRSISTQRHAINISSRADIISFSIWTIILQFFKITFSLVKGIFSLVKLSVILLIKLFTSKIEIKRRKISTNRYVVFPLSTFLLSMFSVITFLNNNELLIIFVSLVVNMLLGLTIHSFESGAEVKYYNTRMQNALFQNQRQEKRM